MVEVYSPIIYRYQLIALRKATKKNQQQLNKQINCGCHNSM